MNTKRNVCAETVAFPNPRKISNTTAAVAFWQRTNQQAAIGSEEQNRESCRLIPERVGICDVSAIKIPPDSLPQGIAVVHQDRLMQTRRSVTALPVNQFTLLIR